MVTTTTVARIVARDNVHEFGTLHQKTWRWQHNVLDPRPNLVYKTLFFRIVMSASSQHWMHTGTRSINLDPTSLSQTWHLLIHFYSKDKWHSGDGSADDLEIKVKGSSDDPLRSNDNIAMGLQEKLWELPWYKQIHPGKLSLLGNASYDQHNEANRNAVSQMVQRQHGRQEGTLHHC